ncbi:MAG: PfkB family carbohydrate kinase [Clostridia bacterium]
MPNQEESRRIVGLPPETALTDGAGDTFAGALTVALAADCSFLEATQFAVTAAGISVTRFGVIESIPTRDEVLMHMRKDDCSWK